MPRFFPLTVTEVRRETRDAIVVSLRPRDQDRDRFDFIQGQHLTFRRVFDGVEFRRSYSICAGRDDGVLQVGIKRVTGGFFSNWVNDHLRAGDVLEAMPPMGAFHAPIEPSSSRHYLGFAAGSGITPLLSIIKTVLAREKRSQFTLVYANRQVQTIMFREELEDLKNRYLGRLSILHILKTDAQDIDLFVGRVDASKCAALFRSWIDLSGIDLAFICGPEPMMLTIAASLREHGMTDAQIKFELFAAAQPGRAATPRLSASVDVEVCEVALTLDGATRHFRMPTQGQSVLEAALASHIDVPYACKAGVCSTCRARVVEGEVEMMANHALEDDEVRRGYVLTCQSYPLTDRLAVNYDV
ncbi:MAG TPA: 1,2-phenylacetyl-CoA epoxidase subunit PaaE [Rhodopila sp.]|uniref:1,2-phenylacetyl-CoA epoxidase subunit PaaE n=1 Tax=Rhodopila sp. TaxID=2480087 RepID=UPI002B93B9D6|nr:1,2-phenylacetyl-CoA epoxidase subunit PaaE [Rhodopila sp.]HVY17117.1 1,2-phenylacetyl-CoA epoxidase subunit PaaE [Rhodopila sp.]